MHEESRMRHRQSLAEQSDHDSEDSDDSFSDFGLVGPPSFFPDPVVQNPQAPPSRQADAYNPWTSRPYRPESAKWREDAQPTGRGWDQGSSQEVGRGSGHGSAQGPSYGSGQSSDYGSGRGSDHGLGYGLGRGLGQCSGYGSGQNSGQGSDYGSDRVSGNDSGRGISYGSGHCSGHCSGQDSGRAQRRTRDEEVERLERIVESLRGHLSLERRQHGATQTDLHRTQAQLERAQTTIRGLEYQVDERQVEKLQCQIEDFRHENAEYGRQVEVLEAELEQAMLMSEMGPKFKIEESTAETELLELVSAQKAEIEELKRALERKNEAIKALL